MKYRLVLSQLGLLMVVLSAIMFGIACWALFDWWTSDVNPEGAEALLASAGLGLVIGGVMWRLGRRVRVESLGRREAMLLVAASWVLGATVSALPYVFWAHTAENVPHDHPFHNYVDCYFEAVSGLTTTGSTVLTNIEALPRALLLWRAMTHWLGGLGIVVLFVAVLPMLGVGGKRLFQIEASKISTGGIRPRITETARILWVVYVCFTLAEIVALRACGLTWFEATCESFATISTGGFSVKNLSIAGYNSPAAEWVIILFMVIGGVNFAIYYQLLRGQLHRVKRDSELYFFLILLVFSSTLALVATMGQPIVGMDGQVVPDTGLLDRMRYAVFNVVSMQTATGFATADFDLWPPLVTTLIYLLVLVGGSAGSTSGGFKVVRLWIMLKVMGHEIQRTFLPHTVKPLRAGATTVDLDMRLSILAFIGLFVLIVLVGSLVLMALEFRNGVEFGTAVTACIAAISNAGPGLGLAGPTENYAWFSPGSKLVLTVIMIAGRLELFAVFVLFFWRFWRER